MRFAVRQLLMIIAVLLAADAVLLSPPCPWMLICIKAGARPRF